MRFAFAPRDLKVYGDEEFVTIPMNGSTEVESKWVPVGGKLWGKSLGTCQGFRESGVWCRDGYATVDVFYLEVYCE